MIKVACVQCNVVFGNPGANARRAIEDLAELKNAGIDLAVYPEAYLTGYCVDSPSEAARIAIAADSQPILDIQKACEELDIMAVVGFAEREALGSGLKALGSEGVSRGGAANAETRSSAPEPKAQSPEPPLFNTAAIFEPGKAVRFYRKSHLPELGLDKFVCRGHGPLEVFDTRIGKIGVLICFDMRMPETARVLALNGAQLLILPTNWPEGAEVTADYVAIARAAENRIFVATCDRVGEENGFKFIGKSKIIDPSGKVLASAGASEETIVAELDLEIAKQKRVVTVPGKYEIEAFKARRPELYLDLVRNLEG
jgi:predicted amidohydrolase